MKWKSLKSGFEWNINMNNVNKWAESKKKKENHKRPEIDKNTINASIY